MPKIADMRDVSRDWPRINMIYTLTKLDGPGEVWLPLNRNYKPLGYPYEKAVDYEDYRHQAIQFARDPMTFKNIWRVDDYGNTHAPFLYDDGYASRVDYLERLGRLLSRSVKVPLQKHRNSSQYYRPKGE